MPDELFLVEPQPAAANASTPSSSAAVARKICRLPLIAVRLTRRLSHDSLTRVLQIHHAAPLQRADEARLPGRSSLALAAIGGSAAAKPRAAPEDEDACDAWAHRGARAGRLACRLRRRGQLRRPDALQHGLRLERPPQRHDARQRPADLPRRQQQHRRRRARARAGRRPGGLDRQPGREQREPRLPLRLPRRRGRASGSSPPRSGPATSAGSSPATGSAVLSARAASSGSTTGRPIRAARVNSVRLEKVGARLDDLAGGTETMLAESTDGRAVAVLRQDGSLGVYSTRGALLRTILPQHGVTEVALRGDYLATLTTADTLEVYNSHSGRRAPHLARRARSALARHQLRARGLRRAVPERRLHPGRPRSAPARRAGPSAGNHSASAGARAARAQSGLPTPSTGSPRTGPARSCSSR